MEVYQSPSHTTWDCNYQVAFIRMCRKRQNLRDYAGILARSFTSGRAEGITDSRTLLAAGSCAHVYQYDAEVCGGTRSGESQGQARDPGGAMIWREEA